MCTFRFAPMCLLLVLKLFICIYREGGFAPWRIVMSRSLDLPEEANLWDVSVAPTIVMTQRGARQSFQKMLRSKGVEVRLTGV